jgi:hypothetical protein
VDRRILIAGGAVVVIAAGVIALTQLGGGEPPKPTPTPQARVTPTPTPSASPLPLPQAGKGLEVGLTELNPNLVASPDDRSLPEPFSQWRDALAAIRPQFFRILVDWAAIQPTQGVPPDLSAYNGGCSRDVPPCQPYGGLRDMLQALASRQHEGGWQAVVVILHTPDWAAQPAGGCERPDTETRSRPPTAEGLQAYGELVKAILATADDVGAQLRFWSAWNEPNHPAFISPQRNTCDPRSPSVAADAYAGLVRTLQATLQAAPGDQQIVLGETAGLLTKGRYLTSVPEFIAGLPRDVVCASTVWSQHGYVGGPDPVPATEKALKARGCPEPFTIWITETGVGPVKRELSAARGIKDPHTGCLALHRRLVRWWRDPQVTAAFQYTFREDTAFPTGLVNAELTKANPTLAEWTAWGGAREPNAPPPAAAC